jgi:hypothetical protein
VFGKSTGACRRRSASGRGVSTDATSWGSLLKHHIPVRTDSWDVCLLTLPLANPSLTMLENSCSNASPSPPLSLANSTTVAVRTLTTRTNIETPKQKRITPRVRRARDFAQITLSQVHRREALWSTRMLGALVDRVLRFFTSHRQQYANVSFQVSTFLLGQTTECQLNLRSMKTRYTRPLGFWRSVGGFLWNSAYKGAAISARRSKLDHMKDVLDSYGRKCSQEGGYDRQRPDHRPPFR